MRCTWYAVAFVAAAGAVGCGSNGGSAAVGGAATFSIGDAAGSNVSPDIPRITLVQGFVGLQVGAFSFEQQTSVQVKRWQLSVSLTSMPMTGQALTIAPSRAAATAPAMATMDIQELPASGAFREWTAVSGSIAVPSRVGDEVRLTFAGVPFQAAQGGSGNQATGTFALTGQITVDNVNQASPN